MSQRVSERQVCDESTFDRSLCWCVEGGTMHTYVCRLPIGHTGDHEGDDADNGCGPCVWTNLSEPTHDR